MFRLIGSVAVGRAEGGALSDDDRLSTWNLASSSKDAAVPAALTFTQSLLRLLFGYQRPTQSIYWSELLI
ncbi:MAG: hypothetical protein ACR2PZ_13545 [Pseudomonadales bacterium]